MKIDFEPSIVEIRNYHDFIVVENNLQLVNKSLRVDEIFKPAKWQGQFPYYPLGIIYFKGKKPSQKQIEKMLEKEYGPFEDSDDMRAEYDFSKAKQGKFYQKIKSNDGK